MKRKAIKDERVTGEVHKLRSHSFGILFVGFMISIIVKAFVLEWELKYWLDSFLIVMVGCLYFTVRSIRAGLFLMPDKPGDVKRLKKRNLISGAAASMFWAVWMFGDDLMAKEKLDVTKSVASILVGAIIFFIGFTWLQWLMIRRSNKHAEDRLE
ncbi:hypothetical protein PAECIP111892_00909 [Paenibacillus auburnensis]|uniref:Uncharacterized protein n=1 Tax=Paenibacillus auburnensis TaxID=2905649 RepID=A0ABM9BRQ5_9BACL|nr:DUF6773 family protein [Paenibacillus auburnensis]CAH1192285.1 hypothetical protein PAECIP111892_00909 [Paenibacillus auburnensis]